MVAVGAHVHNDSAVYRVVGIGAAHVTLLRLTDETGRRRATGEVILVSPASLETDFEPAPDPDTGFQPGRWLRNIASGTLWELRAVIGL